MSKELITFQQLAQADHIEDLIKNDALNELLNRPPRDKWLLPRPAGKGKGKYLPIDKVELLLTAIFQKWHVEIKQTFMLANSVCTYITLHYWIPGNPGEWRRMDGVGAAPLQVDAGTNAADINGLKSSAVQMAAPMSVSYAIKDAAQRLGAIFGRDVNRKDAEQFEGMYKKGAVAATNSDIDTSLEDGGGDGQSFV